MNQTKGILLVFITAAISGVAIFVNQFGVKVSSPYIFTGLKNCIVVLFLLAIILAIGEWKQFKVLRKKQWLTLINIGLIGGSIPFLLFFKGLSMTTGQEGALIHKTMFLPVILMAWLILKEKIDKSLLIGISLLFLGNILLLKLNFNNLVFDKGDFLIFAAVLFWSLEQIISKKAVAKISPRIVALGRLGFGLGFIFIFWIFTDQLSLLANLNFQQMTWTWITGIILLGYVLTWYSGLKYVRVSTAVCILTLGAPITTLLTFSQGAVISLWQVAGILILIMGVSLILIPKKLIHVWN